MGFSVHDGALQIFDVDHGQCALLTLPSPIGMRRVLIDCGHSVNFRGAPWFPGKHLQQTGVDWLDLLVCTNYDEDHVSGFPDLQNRGIRIGCILGNPSVAPETIAKLKTEDGMGDGIRALAGVLAIRKGMGWAQTPPIIPGLDLTWTWNPYPFFEEENNLSLILTLRIHGFCFMFPGDMEKDGFEHALQTCPSFRQAVAGVHVLLAAHHGRENGKCPMMFDVYGCKPQVIVISDDYKQYDTQETTAYYASKARGIAWFRNQGPRYVLTTRSDGEIRFSFQNGSCRVW
jgi:beta-lactamase superfamily II metal-dependent hydrolase